MNDINYSDLTLEGFPDGEFSILWYNHVKKYHKNPQDYKIKLICREQITGEMKAIDRNIKEIPALSLGAIIKNKKLTTTKIGEMYNFSLTVNSIKGSTSLPSEYFHSEESFLFPLKTRISLSNGHEYNVLSNSELQKGLEATNEGKTVFFPAYVIAQYFYFRSASLVRQIMSADPQYKDAVHGLYKSINIDTDGNAEIILNPGASSNDAPEIFRFCHDINPFANKWFHQIHKDIISSNLWFQNNSQYKTQDTTAILKAYFPFSETIDLTFRGVELSENYFLALEIIQENSTYPFETLTIFREHKKYNDRLIPEGKVTKDIRANKITGNLTELTPNSKYEQINVSNDTKHDGRLDLKSKILKYKTIKSDSEAESAKITVEIDEAIDMSSNHEEASGDEKNTQMNTSFSEQKEDPTKVLPTLDDFKIMLYEASNQNKLLSSYIISDLLPLPKKPKSDKSNKKWGRALLTDKKTSRNYLSTFIQYDNKAYYAIEIEQDLNLTGVSTIIISTDDQATIPGLLINSIVENYVKENKSWLSGMQTINFKHKTLIHPETLNKESIKRWAERLLITLQNFK